MTIKITPHVIRANSKGTAFDLRADFGKVPYSVRGEAYKASLSYIKSLCETGQQSTSGQGYCVLISADNLPDTFVVEDMGDSRVMTRSEYLVLCANDSTPVF